MCTSPLTAYPVSGGISFSRPVGHSGRTVQLPCRQCLHCRLQRESEWAIRIMHEALFYPGASWFVTNTLDPEHAFPDSSVSKEAHALYLKRVRHAFGPTRYVGVGEYGTERGRPHYHYALFGPVFSDLVFIGKNARGDRRYSSVQASALWPKGFVELSPLDFGAARYLAGYLSRDKRAKVPGSADFVSDDGVITPRELPFFTMSRRPGIGRKYVEAYGRQLGAGDFVVIEGRKRPAPGYYRRVLDQVDAPLAERLAVEREARVYSPEAKARRRPERLAAKAAILDAKLGLSKRGTRGGVR